MSRLQRILQQQFGVRQTSDGQIWGEQAMQDTGRTYDDGYAKELSGFLGYRAKESGLPDNNPTTRTFPRTLEEAFKDDIKLAQWWYPPEPNTSVWEYLTWTAAFLLWISLAYWYANT